MTPTEFVNLVKSIKYKRGFEFSAAQDWMHGGAIMKLRMLASVPDAGNPDVYITVTQNEWTSVEELSRMEPSVVLHLLKDFILAFERHEFGEWFTIGGKKPFDPHYEGDPAVLEASVFGETYGRGE